MHVNFKEQMFVSALLLSMTKIHDYWLECWCDSESPKLREPLVKSTSPVLFTTFNYDYGYGVERNCI